MLGPSGDVAIEVKGTENVQPRDLNGLAAYMQEHQPRLAIVVCNETKPRRNAAGIVVLPWRDFLERLWDGRIVE